MASGTDTAEWLQTYGPWAVVVICLAGIAVLWRKLNEERATNTLAVAKLHADHDTQLITIAKEHKAEMQVVVDRLIASSNAQVDKFKDLAEQNARVVEALTRRVKPRGDGGS